MTTTITVETHTWPVQIDTEDDHSYSAPDGSMHRHGFTSTTEFVPANTKKQVHITNTRTVRFTELREGATSLNNADEYMGEPTAGGAAIANLSGGNAVAGTANGY